MNFFSTIFVALFLNVHANGRLIDPKSDFFVKIPAANYRKFFENPEKKVFPFQIEEENNKESQKFPFFWPSP